MTGGRLCYFTEDTGLFVPQRPSGTLSVHVREMHAVSKLLSGVRYVLFVVDDTNGLGGSTENIVTLKQGLLDKMHASTSLLTGCEGIHDNDLDREKGGDRRNEGGDNRRRRGKGGGYGKGGQERRHINY